MSGAHISDFPENLFENAIDQLDDLNFGMFGWYSIPNPEGLVAADCMILHLSARAASYFELAPAKSDRLNAEIEKLRFVPLDGVRDHVVERLDRWLFFRRNLRKTLNQNACDAARAKFLSTFDDWFSNRTVSAFALNPDQPLRDAPWSVQLGEDLVIYDNESVHVFHTGWSS